MVELCTSLIADVWRRQIGLGYHACDEIFTSLFYLLVFFAYLCVLYSVL